MQFTGTIKACMLGAVAATIWEPTSPPQFSPSEIAAKHILLPDGRKVTVERATSEEFYTFASAITEQVAQRIMELVVVLAGEAEQKKIDRIRSSITLARQVLGGLPDESDLLDRWYVLLELAFAIGGSRSKYHVDIPLFVEQEVEV